VIDAFSVYNYVLIIISLERGIGGSNGDLNKTQEGSQSVAVAVRANAEELYVGGIRFGICITGCLIIV
jgi:hypothetical protein